MSDGEKTAAETKNPQPIESLVLDLNFVPAWARQAPTADPYAGRDLQERPRDSSRRESGRDRPRRDDRRGSGAPRGDKRNDRRGRGPGSPRDRHDSNRRGPRRDADLRRGQAAGRSGPQRDREPFLPVQVSFLPDHDRLVAMAADIRTSQHAFPLPELAHLFLSRPEWHAVKIEANKRSGGVYVFDFYQCKLTGQLYLSREAALEAAADAALTECFLAESEQQDAPAGNFVCVGRCRLSGELLPPPNHHAHKEALRELHRSRFSHLTLDDYSREIETVRDSELIEQWKERWRTKTVYRRKPETEDGEPGEPIDLATARQISAETIAPSQVAKVHRVVISGQRSRELQEPRFTRVLRAAWSREQRFPITLVRALRGAFKRMGMHLFETKEGAVFVTAIKPHPVDAGRVIEVIREILVWLKDHPGCSRSELIEGIRPGITEDPVKLGEVLQPLTWLVDKGHVIEFHNGTLAVPKDTPT